jgi:hypothetical protein
VVYSETQYNKLHARDNMLHRFVCRYVSHAGELTEIDPTSKQDLDSWSYGDRSGALPSDHILLNEHRFIHFYYKLISKAIYRRLIYNWKKE